MNLFSIFPIICIIFVFERSSVAIKKGRREGTTELAQRTSPLLAADRLLFEKNTKQMVNSKKTRGIVFLFIVR